MKLTILTSQLQGLTRQLTRTQQLTLDANPFTGTAHESPKPSAIAPRASEGPKRCDLAASQKLADQLAGEYVALVVNSWPVADQLAWLTGFLRSEIAETQAEIDRVNHAIYATKHDYA